MPSHLHFVQSIEPLQGGGLGRAALELHQAFLSPGHDSRLAATHGPGFTPPEVPGLHCFPRSGPAKLYWSPELPRAADKLADAVDAVHGHGLYVGTNYAFGRAARRHGKPLVYHVHGFFEPWILGRSRWRKRLVHLLFENANVRAAALWRALTAKEADQIRACGIRAPVVVAPNGIDLAPFDAPDPAPAPKDRSRVVFLARLHPKKGADLLLRAWAALRPPDWELVLAGPDEAGHRAELEALARRLDLGSAVTLPGLVTGPEKIALLRSADLFALTSHSEGFPMGLLEAMAAGVPLLATEQCNLPEARETGAGWLCQPEVKSITDTLRTALAASESERRDRGRAGRRLVEERYQWSAIVKTLDDAIAALPSR